MKISISAAIPQPATGSILPSTTNASIPAKLGLELLTAPEYIQTVPLHVSAAIAKFCRMHSQEQPLHLQVL